MDAKKTEIDLAGVICQSRFIARFNNNGSAPALTLEKIPDNAVVIPLQDIHFVVGNPDVMDVEMVHEVYLAAKTRLDVAGISV